MLGVTIIAITASIASIIAISASIGINCCGLLALLVLFGISA